MPDTAPYPLRSADPLVVVGSGPVGQAAVGELLRRAPERPVVIYGAEPCTPYRRTDLTALLAGDLNLVDVQSPLAVPAGLSLTERYGCPVVAVDTHAHRITDAAGRSLRYGALLLATGARARLPTLPGMDLDGVFAPRGIADVERLLARRARSRRLVVLGGGPLGVELARALRRAGTEVILIEHANRLLYHYLDPGGAELLREWLLALDVRVLLGTVARAVLGRGRVEGLQLRDGRVVACDTLVVAGGSRPDLELARTAGLRVRRGIWVNDRLQTSAPDVYAAGDCAEHRGCLTGLVEPGLRQGVAAAVNMLGGRARYQPSPPALRLRLPGRSVASVGVTAEAADPLATRRICYGHPERGVHRTLVVQRGRLAGAVAVGAWPELEQVTAAIAAGLRLWPWQLRRFQHQGQVWSAR